MGHLSHHGFKFFHATGLLSHGLPPASSGPSYFYSANPSTRTPTDLPGKCLTWCGWCFKIMEHEKTSLPASLPTVAGGLETSASFSLTLLRKRSEESIQLWLKLMSMIAPELCLTLLHSWGTGRVFRDHMFNVKIQTGRGEAANDYCMIWEINYIKINWFWTSHKYVRDK